MYLQVHKYRYKTVIHYSNSSFPFYLSLIFFPDVVNVVIEDGILHWELPNDLQQQVAAYHVLIYREGHRMEFPPVWVVGMSYNLNDLNLAAGTYYIEVCTFQF